MPQTITLDLPDTIYLPAKRTAEATERPVEEILVNALESSLPSLEGLPAALIAELTELETLSDEELRCVMLGLVPVAQQQRLDHLLTKNQAGILSEQERQELDTLQQEADRIMLRKARAAVLLRFRGHRLPTLEELRKLTKQS